MSGATLRNLRSIKLGFGFFLFLCVFIGLVVGSYNFNKKNISGEGFLIQWISLRALVVDGISPYDNSVTEQIQDLVKYQSSFIDGNLPRYTSPLSLGIIFFPFALTEDKVAAHTLWQSIQLIAFVFILLAGLKLTGWKPSWISFFLFSILATLSYHFVLPWLDGGLSIWAAFFLICSFLAIRNQWNEIGGIFMALSAVQPQMTILVILFTLIWGLSKRNKLLILWFFITIISLSVIAFVIVPGWIGQYLKMIYNFSEFFPTGNPGLLFRNLWPGLGKQLGWLMTGILCMILMIEWYFSLKKDFRWFMWSACLTMVVSQWIGIHSIPGNFIGLIFPLMLVSAMLSERWHLGGQWIAVFFALLFFIWEWVLFFNNLNHIQPFSQLNLLIPLPLVLIIGLYWVRWWAIKPKRLLIEEIRLGETY